MKLLKVFFFLVGTFMQLNALDVSLLTSDKQEIFKQKQREIAASAVQLKYNWVSPVMLSTTISSAKGINDAGHNSYIQLNQDVYRSGGIGKSMRYADGKLAYEMISLEEENAVLYEELLVGLLERKQLKLTLKQVQYQLKNAQIQVFLKKQQYKTGNADITEINDALMNKNSILRTILTSKENIIDKEIVLQKLTYLPLKKIKVKYFKQLSQNSFVKNNFDVLQAMLESELSGTQYEITKTDYLPTVSVSGQVGYQDVLEHKNLSTLDNNYHSVGLTLSMPLSYTSKSDIEEKKVSYLKTKASLSDIKYSKIGLYKQKLNKIKNYREHNKVVQTNIKLYTELVDIAKKSFKAGYKPGYDLKTLQNTKKIDILEIQINKINIQIEKAKLHFACNLGERYYAREY